ncbi:MAG: hypothetical protein EHM81_01600 [Chloroflexi bacterium]|nr:MAG: hypothetical protein EHM81_01600 [Chloroflexota bacterium]
MSTSVSLRRSLRKIQTFRLLPRRDLETIIERMIYKEYKPGEVLWRTSAQTDFLGIIQRGDIVVEYRVNGSVIRSVKLSAGDFMLPRNLKGANTHSTVLTRAVTDVRLCVLRMDQIDILRSKWSGADISLSQKIRYDQSLTWKMLWIAIVVCSIMFLSWNDMIRVASGILYSISDNASQSTYDDQRALELLKYAESIDPEAVFAHNREGYLWFQRKILPKAKEAFEQALEIDQVNGPVLNNLSVMYFATDQVSQAMAYQQRAVQNDPDSALVKYNMGVVLMKQNYNIDALREFKEASFINPTWALPYIQQGFLYTQAGDYVKSEDAARKAIKIDFTQKPAHLILAIALYNQDKSREALKTVEYILRIDPEDRISRFYMARILSDLGEFDAALLTLKRLLKSTTDPGQISRITAEIEAIHRFLKSLPPGAR